VTQKRTFVPYAIFGRAKTRRQTNVFRNPTSIYAVIQTWGGKVLRFTSTRTSFQNMQFSLQTFVSEVFDGENKVAQ
jgi:hypothetical protein